MYNTVLKYVKIGNMATKLVCSGYFNISDSNILKHKITKRQKNRLIKMITDI